MRPLIVLHSHSRCLSVSLGCHSSTPAVPASSKDQFAGRSILTCRRSTRSCKRSTSADCLNGPPEHIKSNQALCARRAEADGPLGNALMEARSQGRATRQRIPDASSPTTSLSPQLGRRSEHEEPFCLCTRLCRSRSIGASAVPRCPNGHLRSHPGRPRRAADRTGGEDLHHHRPDDGERDQRLQPRQTHGDLTQFSLLGLRLGITQLGAGHPFERHLWQHRAVDQLDEQGSQLYAVCDLRAPAWPTSPSLPVTRTSTATASAQSQHRARPSTCAIR